MALITEPPDKATGDNVAASDYNTLKERIYDEFNGNIDNANVKTAANIAATKIANVAAVLGGGAEQAMVNPFNQSLPRLETAAANHGTLTGAPSATRAIVAGKLFQTTDTTDLITLLTGGTEDQIIIIKKIHAVTITHTAADTLNSIHLKTLDATTTPSNHSGSGTAANPMLIKLIYTTLGGTFANLQWVEI